MACSFLKWTKLQFFSIYQAITENKCRSEKNLKVIGPVLIILKIESDCLYTFEKIVHGSSDVKILKNICSFFFF